MPLNATISGDPDEQSRTIKEVLDGLEETVDYARLPAHRTGAAPRIVLTVEGTRKLLGGLGIELVSQDIFGDLSWLALQDRLGGASLTGSLAGASLTGGAIPAYGAGDLSSVTLVRNAKGGVQPEVKVYAANPAEAQQRAVEIFDALATKYPHVNAGAAGDKKGE